jgi:DNA-binding response OmpR family regulator
VKPFDMDELVEKVKRFLSMHQDEQPRGNQGEW